MAAKKRLNKSHRSVIYNWMCETKIPKQNLVTDLQKGIEELAALINPIIRAKYPEKDMQVLRKYSAARKDTCLKFLIPENGRVFGVDVSYWRHNFPEDSVTLFSEKLADVPNTGGCRNNIVFEGTEEIEGKFEALCDYIKGRLDFVRKKENKYWTFVEQCKYLEEVEHVVPLPEEVREKIMGGSTYLVAMNPEVLADIKEEFASV